MLKQLMTAVGLLVWNAMSFAATLSVQLMDAQSKPLADAVVMVYPVQASHVPGLNNTNTATSKARSATDIALSQLELQFERYVTVVPVGTEISFPNKDRIEHHIKSLGPTQNFELKVYKPGDNRKVLFDRPGPSAIVCHFHNWMRAWVYAVDTPYHGKSAETGWVRVENLPEGKYEIRVWHPDSLAQPDPQVIQVKNGLAPLQIATQAVPRKRSVPKQYQQSDYQYSY